MPSLRTRITIFIISPPFSKVPDICRRQVPKVDPMIRRRRESVEKDRPIRRTDDLSIYTLSRMHSWRIIGSRRGMRPSVPGR